MIVVRFAVSLSLVKVDDGGVFKVLLYSLLFSDDLKQLTEFVS